MCDWFLLCKNKPTTTRAHPILGKVKICEPCDEKIAKLMDEEPKRAKAT